MSTPGRSSKTDQTWVEWFLSSPRGSVFIRVDDAYLNDVFNYYGIRQKVPNFRFSFDLIRGPYLLRERRPAEWPSDIDDYGMCLYGLIHARYLMTSAGQERMLQKYQSGFYPKCPRMLCSGCSCVPYGTSDDIGESNVKLFCPNCQDVYSVNDRKYSNMDGAFFGPSWVHLFLIRYPHLIPSELPRKYIPRIFGFRIAPPPHSSG
jgi:casein kinase II subunit beta